MKKLLAAIIVFMCYIAAPDWGGYDAERFYNLGLESTMANTKINYFTRAIDMGGDKRTIGKAYSARAKAYRELGENERAEVDLKKAVNLDPVYDIYKTFTTTEYLADSAGRSGSVSGVGWMGAAGLIAIFFVMIFKLTLPSPRKGDEDNDSRYFLRNHNTYRKELVKWQNTFSRTPILVTEPAQRL